MPLSLLWYNSFIFDIKWSGFSKFSKTAQNIWSTLLLVISGLTWPRKDVFWDQTQTSEDKTPYLLIFEYARLQSYFLSRSKTRIYGIFGNFTSKSFEQWRRFICAEKTNFWQLIVPNRIIWHNTQKLGQPMLVRNYFQLWQFHVLLLLDVFNFQWLFPTKIYKL